MTISEMAKVKIIENERKWHQRNGESSDVCAAYRDLGDVTAWLHRDNAPRNALPSSARTSSLHALTALATAQWRVGVSISKRAAPSRNVASAARGRRAWHNKIIRRGAA
jgi:hypothetical protein